MWYNQVAMNKTSFGNIMVTGGAGFIGSNFIRHLLEVGSVRSGEYLRWIETNYAGR